MTAYLLLPVSFLRFWYIDAPLGIVSYFGSLNKAFFQLFSLPLMLRSFFEPIKNEYRSGLVGFSIGLGIFVKTCIILADLVLFIPLLLLEISFVIFFLLFPILSLTLPFF